MHLEGHRKRKSSNEDSNNCVSKLTTPPKRKTGSSSICSNEFAVSNLFEQLEEGKYGSVTKDYEALHPQRMQLIKLISTISPLRQSIAPLTDQSGTSIFTELSARKDQINPQRSADNLSCNVIDLEDDPLEVSANPVRNLAEQTQEACTVVCKDSPPTNKEEKEQAEVIVLDSDEEDDVSHQIRNNHDFRPGQDASALRSLLTSEIQKHISRASKLAQEANSFQLVPYYHGMGSSDAVNSFKSNWQPSIQYEKVVLQTVQQEQRFQHVVNENSVQIRIDRDEEAPSTVMNVFPIHNVKRKERKRKEHLACPKPGSAIAVSCMAVQGSSHMTVLENSSIPVQENSTMPVQENSSMPLEEKSSMPVQEKSSMPLKEKSSMPVQEKSIMPVQEKSSMPVQEKSSMPVQEKSRMPVQEYSCLGDFDEDDKVSTKSDGLDDLWKDMSLAMECSKVDTQDDPAIVQEEEEEECNHSYMLQDDFGLVCRICGVIQKSIDTIFDFQWTKGSRSIRTYLSTSRSSKDLDEAIEYSELQVSEDDFVDVDVSIHPRHLKQMKPHQHEGFKFLVKNLVTEKPGGCILAHAPGSGKTFMLISFLQSFLAKYPSKKPLVVLPKGILPVWKKELQRWQVEDLPVYDFYSFKADNRSQQLEVLKLWQEKKSILFLGYKQFSNIISDKENSKASAACREILLKVPGLLILDEGHTPRNEETYMLDSLAKVQTPRKVVLSGTLFQNHVREVFNILNLVRPKFLKMKHSRAIVKRVLSRVHISGGRKLTKSSADNAFYELVEETLQSDENFRRKVTVIEDLRELTKDVLHYYKGDFLEELPGLVDFTVLLNLSGKQKSIVQKLARYEKFKRTSLASAVYMHPDLYETAEKAPADRATITSFKDDKIDRLCDSTNPRDGVKAKFFLNILSLAECAGEKLLAFSQYLLPLRFLERLMVKTKGWHTGKEIFMICGDSSTEERERYMEQFNNSPDAKVFLGSIKACGEGISLVGASRVLILDVHLNPSVTRQAIGRAFRPGQVKKVYTYRLVAADSPEEEDHNTSFSKELTSKMWFEWTEYHNHQDFNLDEVSPTTCEDMFLESPLLAEDIKAVYRR